MDRQLPAGLRREEPEQGPANSLVFGIDYPILRLQIALREAVLLILVAVYLCDHLLFRDLVAVEDDPALDGAPFLLVGSRESGGENPGHCGKTEHAHPRNITHLLSSSRDGPLPVDRHLGG